MVKDTDFQEKLKKCVRCGACKTLCPTYLTTHNESFGARGRVAMLGELGKERLAPSGNFAEKIFSCMLCGACKGVCPAGIDIPEVIYEGRTLLKKSYKKGRFLRALLQYSAKNMDRAFTLMRTMQKMSGAYDHVPRITATPFHKSVQLYKNLKKIGRVAIFGGCSVNYLYPELGRALSNILHSAGYEVVIFKGESCCGAPFRSMGYEEEAVSLARKNIEHFNKVRAEAIISLCPTCTMVIREHYPVFTGDTIKNIVDVNEFMLDSGISDNLEVPSTIVTYHDPCHQNYGLNIKEMPRRILKGIRGVEFREMPNSGDCCGFAGMFNIHFREIAEEIGTKKAASVSATSADTVVTSCPGCVMQLESLMKRADNPVRVKHIVEVLDEAVRAKS